MNVPIAQTHLSDGAGPAWCDLERIEDLASLDLARQRHMRRAAADAVDHLIPLMDALDAATEDMEPEAGYDLPEGDDKRCGSSGVDGEDELGWPACVSQLRLGFNTPDGDATALERHGKGFLRSGHDDAEEDDPAERDDEHGSDDGEDIGNHASQCRPEPLSVGRRAEVAARLAKAEMRERHHV